MAVLFSSRPGTVQALDPTDGDEGLPLSIDGSSGSWFPTYKSILTGFNASLSGSYQYTHSFKDVIYSYVFGDRIGQIRIAGIAFASECDAVGAEDTGVERILRFYRQNRIANRATPIQIAIGTTPAGRFRGQLTDLQLDLSQAANRLSQFALVFQAFPGN